jgi:hypothetical protein
MRPKLITPDQMDRIEVSLLANVTENWGILALERPLFESANPPLVP